MEYYCTACGEYHEIEEDKEPETALDIFEKHPNAPDWIEDFDAEQEGEPEAICESCLDCAVIVIEARDEAIRLGRDAVSVF